MADGAKLVAVVEANTKQFENAMKRLERLTNQTLKTSKTNTDRLNQSVQQVTVSTGKLARTMESIHESAIRAGRSLSATFAGVTAGIGVQSLVAYADAWTRLGNRVKSAGDVAGVQVRSLSALNDMARESRSTLEGTVNLYSRLTIATKELAVSEQDIARATDIVTKAFKVGGATTAEQISGITQLGQALSSGVLQGDELRSLRENASLLAQAIAEEFDTTIGGLKKLGAAGDLEARRVLQGILNAQPQIERAFSQTQSTIGEAIQAVSDTFLELVGTINEATGASSGLVRAMKTLQTEIRTLQSGNIREILINQGAPQALVDLVDQALTEIDSLTNSSLTSIEQAVRKAGDAATPVSQQAAAIAELAREIDQLAQSVRASPVFLRGDLPEEQVEELERIVELMGEATPEAARDAAIALQRLAETNPEFEAIAAKGRVLLDFLGEISAKAKAAEDAIIAALEGREIVSASDLAREAGGQQAEFFRQQETEASRSEFDRQVEKKADELIKAADELGIALDRAAARIEARRLLGLEAEAAGAPAIGSEDAVESFVDRVVAAEAPQGGPNLAGASSAFGVGQFIESTWLDLFAKYFPERAAVMGREAILDLRDDARVSKQMIELYAQENARVLQKAGVSVNEAALHLSHFLGAGDAVKVLQAAPGTPLAGLISSKSIAANPRELGGGKTVDDVLRYAQGRAAGPSTQDLENKKKEAEDAAKDAAQAAAELEADIASFEEMLKREGEAIDLETKSLRASTAEKEYLAEKQRLTNALIDAGIPITENYTKTIEQLAQKSAALVVAQEQFDLEQERTQEAMQATTEQADALRDATNDVLGGLASDLLNGVKPAEALANALGKILDQLIQIGVNALTEGLLGPQGSPLGGLLGGILGPLVPTLHTGGVAGQGGAPRRVSPLAFVGAPRMHTGGVAGVAPWEVPAILKRGEIVTPGLPVPSVASMSARAKNNQRVGVDNKIVVEPSPLFIATVDTRVRQGEENAVKRAAGYISDKQRRQAGGRV